MAKTPAQQKLSEAVARINTQTGFVQPTKTAPLVLDNSAYWVNKKELIPMPTNWNLAKLPSVLPSWFTPAETKDINFISQAQWGPQTTPWNRDSAGGGTYVPPNSKAWPTTFSANTQTSSSWSNNNLGKNQTGATKPNLYPTASNPVTTLSKNSSGLQEYNYDDILSKDARGLKDYIDLIQINQQQGYKPTTEELYKVKKASDRLQELNAPTNLPDPYKAQIDAENQARQQREAELKARDENIISTEEARIKATLDQRKAEQDRQGVQVWEQTQSVLSFSGFGRSTYAADKQAEIQQTTNQNKNILTAEAEANKAKYRAQIAGATREELNQYDERINALKDKSAELQITNALQLNQIHQQEWVSYEDKVQNIFELADKNKPEIPLTPQQTQQASSYAKLIIWADWNVDTNLMKTIPPELLPEVMRQGAELRGATAGKQKEFGFVNVWDWVIARTNPNTGEVEYTKSWFTKEEKAKAPETIKTDTGTFQYNSSTDRYDIPVGVTSWATWDLRNLAGKFPWQAWAKNNNPAWITRNSNFDNNQWTAKLLTDAGIKFEKWTPRPASEGGNYVLFNTIEDGLAAQRVMYTQTYWNSTVWDMLKKRVGTWEANNYANQISQGTWLNLNTKMSNLSDDQLQILQQVQIKKESPGLAGLLYNQSTQQAQWSYEPQTAEEEQLLASVTQSKGKKVLPAGTVTMLSDWRGLPNIVSELEKIVNDNGWKFWPVAWRIWGWNEYDTDAQNIQAKMKLVAQIVGKFMEWWVLRKEDEVKYEKMLPTLKDNPEVALSKIESVKNVLESKYKWYIQDYSNNYDVSWFPIQLFWQNTAIQGSPTNSTGWTQTQWTSKDPLWLWI